ncbi:hypothetical protein ABZ517_05580 [Streptomyces scabiei]|uniref:hypothetical protein n=1 Tax=Streptomyces scabiei TaxID=1930 RepID=UPI0033C92B40
MAELTLNGTLRTRYLNEIRGAQVFRVEAPVTLTVEAIYSEPVERLVWMECHQGTWRLPPEMRQFAEEVEERAQAILGRYEIFPCHIVFAPGEGDQYEVELRPRGYRHCLPT